MQLKKKKLKCLLPYSNLSLVLFSENKIRFFDDKDTDIIDSVKTLKTIKKSQLLHFIK